MKKLILQTVFIVFTITLFNSHSFAQSIDGTYVLESRVMADGTKITPPSVMGVYNLEAGYSNFNVAYKNSSGKVQSISFFGKYRFNSKEFYQEILFINSNDQIGGSGNKYDFEPKSGTSPVKITGNKIEFTYPPNHTIKATFEGDTLKARPVNGAYTDNWKKVK